MADVTVLRCWPACVDAIDWSPDGIIALASDEHVELLFPNTVDFDRDQLLAQWQHVSLKVPLFSTDELPLKEPAPLSTYSLGEEISNSAPINISWSPPGLAKHRRCALATLTANLTLSIWSVQGKPDEASSWARRLIVNDALVDHFSDWDHEPSHLTVPSKERLRLRSRIRAYSWAPVLPCPGPAGVIGTRLLYGQHIVAVANDDNYLAFVLIESPTSTLGAHRNWRAHVLTHDCVEPGPESIFSNPTCFEHLMSQQRYISRIAWGPWIVRGDCYHSVVVYATNEDVTYTGFELRYDGPMKFYPTVENGDRLKLALFTNSGLFYLTISAHDASIINKTTHDIDGRWDQVSGAVWDTARDSSSRLHVSSLLSTLHNPTAVLDVSADRLKSLSAPSWREQIENNLALFSVKNELKGNSKAKVWGLTISPLGDFIAACVSMHPSDMIEYGIPADRRATVAISSLQHTRQQRAIFPSENVSAEGVAYTLKKLAENAVEDPQELPRFAEEMVEMLLQAYGHPLDSNDDVTTSAIFLNASDLSALTIAFKKSAFLESHTLRDRYTILVSHACKTGSSEDLARTLIAYRLATALQRLPSSLCCTSFSAEILAQHRHLIALIDSVMTLDTRAENSTDGHASQRPSQNGSGNITHLEPVASWTDACDFCSAPIPFTDLTSAACTNGHQFPRCGLSFLAIQAPGITKYCGICTTPFLSDEFVIAQESVDEKKHTDAGQDAVMTEGFDSGEVAPMGDTREQGQEPMNVKDMNGERAHGGQEDPGEAQADSMKDSESSNEGELAEEKKRQLPVSLARVLFLACDACIYCGGKFVD
ncbi:hypothetical protein BDW02DRAFT_558254 [Decorospora gaudefroyi]|uniref:Transcription factor IIIC putative zinc-finger domain-containing protein n=1 Tax=Decorospora gaudefroyi TaxID=184978 RepID=A0A6A5JZR7_9PLEO|nr:hypothetical protein BDW02DRAFT_558254 [Decorospora gaudefroyi]